MHSTPVRVLANVNELSDFLDENPEIECRVILVEKDDQGNYIEFSTSNKMIQAKRAMNAAKKASGWDDMPASIHKHLDDLFKALE